MNQIISIVLNNFKNDSRVLKENISLQNAGYEVKVVALHEEPLKEFEEIQNTQNEDKRISGKKLSYADRTNLRSASTRQTINNSKNLNSKNIPKSSKSRPNFEGGEQ